jgi:hypothetical protein
MSFHSPGLNLRLESFGDRLQTTGLCGERLLWQHEIANALPRVRRLGADALRILNWRWQRPWELPSERLRDERQLRTIMEELGGIMLPQLAVDILAANSNACLSLLVTRSIAMIPWEMARVDGVSLMKRFAVGRVIHDTFKSEQTSQPSVHIVPRKFTIWAHPEQNLMMAEHEAAEIQSLVLRERRRQGTGPVVKLHRGPGTKQQLLEKLHAADWFHFAGHAQTHADQRVLVLSGDVLAARDIIESPGPYPQLVFANACGSAMVGPDESSDSLVEALMSCGVDNVVGLWNPIGDRESVGFATDFYRRLLQGSGIGQALQLARLDYAERHGWDERVLGNYVLYGHPDSTFCHQSGSNAPERNSPRRGADQPASTGQLSFPVVCESCGRRLKSRFLVHQSWQVEGHWKVCCRACSMPANSSNGSPVAKSDHVRTSLGVFMSPSFTSIADSWRRLLESLTTTRPILNPDIGEVVSTSWTHVPAGSQRSPIRRLVSAKARGVDGGLPFEVMASEMFQRHSLTAFSSTPGNHANRPLPAWELTAQCLARCLGGSEPLTLSELLGWLDSTTEHRSSQCDEPAKHRAEELAIRFLVLVSATGWTDEALQWCAQHRNNVDSPTNTRLALIDPRLPLATYRVDDLWLRALAEYLRWEDPLSRLRRVMEYVQRKRPLTVSLAATDLVQALNVPLDDVLVALRNVVYSESQLALDDIPAFGWVLSERAN